MPNPKAAEDHAINLFYCAPHLVADAENPWRVNPRTGLWKRLNRFNSGPELESLAELSRQCYKSLGLNTFTVPEYSNGEKPDAL